MAPRADTEPTAEPLTAVQEAAMGDSLDAYRDAKKLEAAEPRRAVEKPEPKPEAAKPEPAAIETRAAVPERHRSRREREQDAANARTQKAVEAATADLRKELDTLKRSATAQPPRQPEPTPRAEPVVAKPAAATEQADYDRYLALPDAPKVADFQAAGKSYEQFNAALHLFILDKRDTERAQRASVDSDNATRFDQERARAGKLKIAFDADPDIKALFKIVAETQQWPENAVYSREVLGLRTFYLHELENKRRTENGEAALPVTVYNAIAEEVASSDHPVALAKHLSKPGELARLAALPDARSLIREMNRIETELSTPKPVKTKTSVGEPAMTLTSARATDPLDPVESALRSGIQSDYKRARLDERLRDRGLLK